MANTNDNRVRLAESLGEITGLLEEYRKKDHDQELSKLFGSIKAALAEVLETFGGDPRK